MNKALIKKIWVVVAIVGMSAFVCQIVMNEPFFMDSQQIRYPDVLFSGYEDMRTFEFDPKTIIESIDNGEVDVFTLQNLDDDIGLDSHSAAWGQAEYLRVAYALQRFVSNESTEGWILHDMSFYGDCTYDTTGFDIVTMSFYKSTGLQQYSARLIGIYPPSGKVQWGQGGKYPRSIFGGWKNIDTQKLKITVEEAIRLAEENGGKQARLAVSNQCRINASLGPYPYPEWSVIYDRATNSEYIDIFEASIDPYTGDYEIITSPAK